MRATAIVLLLGSIMSPPLSWAGDKTVSLLQSEAKAPEAALVDVGILVFDPGLPDDTARLRKLEADGIFAEVRESEAVYIPVQLERTLQKVGYWGAVRVSPKSVIVDLTVSGTILKSDGNELSLDVRAVDSRGKVWLDKRYKEDADASVYVEGESADDPFQSLYNRIANDLLSARKKIDQEDVESIASVSRLRFAADLAAVPFADYLQVKKDRYAVVRLPARDDPMMGRVDRLRQRDRMFIDVLDDYYRGFYQKMQEAYGGWRSENYWEHEALESAGRLSLAGSRSVGVSSTSGRLPWENPGVICGTPAVLDGVEREEPLERAEREAEARKRSHLAALRELGASLATDMAPHLVDLEGNVRRLTGSVENQYAKWRELLREIFAMEAGLSPR